MYEAWKPLGIELETHPGIDISISEGTSVRIRLSNWRSGNCIFALDVSFKHGLAGMLTYDESSHFELNISPELDENSAPRLPYPAWIERGSERIQLYSKYGPGLYKRIDSYYIHGQSAILLLDIADAEPVLTEILPSAINNA